MKAYVLGAGASAHAGYPLAPSLLKELSGWLDRTDSSEDWVSLCRPCIGQLRETFGDLDVFEVILGKLNEYEAKRVKPTRATTYGQNQEDILNACTERMRRAAMDALAQGRLYPQNLRDNLIIAVREFFHSIERSCSGELAYDAFARKIDLDSLVITLNYDVALERALAKAGKWDVGTGYGFKAFADRAPSTTTIYKLHGSVNWFQAPTQECPPPIMFPRDLTLLGYPDLADPRVGKNGVAINNSGTLILPDPQKKFFWDRLWSQLWGAAAQRLGEACEVFIHGYSMPTADLKARELLFGNINPEAAVNIQCRSASDRLAAEFRDRGFSNVKSFPAIGFEAWAVEED